MASGITLATGATPGAPYSGTNVQLSHAIQTVWSKEILFQAMPVLRFEQFAVKKTELGVMPGLTINFMRYNNLSQGGEALTEGTRMETVALSTTQYTITVSEHGKATAVSELLLNASFDDVMASASRLLGRNMALYLDKSARDTVALGTAAVYGYSAPASTTAAYGQYAPGTVASGATVQDKRRSMTGAFFLSPHAVKDAVETLSVQNVPRIGDTYVCFVHPHQSRRLRDWPEWIEVSKYAAPGNFMLGEIGRLNDVVFIETTQCRKVTNGAGGTYTTASDASDDVGDGAADRYHAYMIGDNAFGHAISLPVELRDGGVLDFGREHALAWYSIWGFGKITDEAIVNIETN